MGSKGRHLKGNHNFRVSRRVPETSKRATSLCYLYICARTATPQLRNGRQTAIQSGIRKLSGLGRKLLLINGSKGMGQRPGDECCSNGQSRCCQRHRRNPAGPGPGVSRSSVAWSPAQEAGPHKQALWALASSSAVGHLEDKWVEAAHLPQG